jgi:hypothetical protein
MMDSDVMRRQGDRDGAPVVVAAATMSRKINHHVTGADPPRNEAKTRHAKLDVGCECIGMR